MYLYRAYRFKLAFGLSSSSFSDAILLYVNDGILITQFFNRTSYTRAVGIPLCPLVGRDDNLT